MSSPADSAPAADAAGPDFLRAAVRRDVDAGRYGGRVRTRFPPEPSGYLHIGHVKAICINFGVADEFGGVCALRYDDTNPEREDTHYVEQIKTDIRWLGFDWGEREYYASDYFERLYELAVQLIEAGKAYVDHLTVDQIIEYRGVAQSAGRDSPYRDRPVAENLDLFRRMRTGVVRGGLLRAARQDRHGGSQRLPARPGDVPHHAHRPSPHRRPLVHLPDLRLGARAVGLHRGGHPLPVHAGVRDAPAAVRLVHRRRLASFRRARSSTTTSTSRTR